MTAVCHLWMSEGRFFFRRFRRSWDLVGYPSGQRGQTVNLLAYAFDGSNPSPTTTLFLLGKPNECQCLQVFYRILDFWNVRFSALFGFC
jgi:hypothetical protein